MLRAALTETALLPESGLARPRDVAHEAEILAYGAGRFYTSLCGTDGAERPELEAFVRQVFGRAHGASIRHFMPQLMSLRDAGGELLAVCGLRNAAEAPLFLERYLEAPVERLVSARSGAEVLRHDIVEVGNLAVAAPGTAPLLLASVSQYLHSTAAEWAVFTAIPILKNSLSRLNMQLEVLGKASIECIPEAQRGEWGSYYDRQPQVMAVRRNSRPTMPTRSLAI